MTTKKAASKKPIRFPTRADSRYWFLREYGKEVAKSVDRLAAEANDFGAHAAGRRLHSMASEIRQRVEEAIQSVRTAPTFAARAKPAKATKPARSRKAVRS